MDTADEKRFQVALHEFEDVNFEPESEKTFTTRFTILLINLQFNTTPAYALPSHNLRLECFNLSNVEKNYFVINGYLRNWRKHTNTRRSSLSTTRLLKSKPLILQPFCEILMV